MIVNLVILAIGVLLGVLAVVLRAKLGKEWMISLVCGAVLVSAVGGIFAWASWKDQQDDRQHIYVALQYLERYDVSRASYHLKKVGEDSFASCSAQALLETMRNNAILAQLRLDTSEQLAKTDEQRGAVARMRTLTAFDTEEQSRTAALLSGMLQLSQRRKAEADTLFATESGYSVQGVDLRLEDLSERERLRYEVNDGLNNANYAQAVSSAARLVEHTASADNRLLLAEAVAEAVFNGQYLTDQIFHTGDGETPQNTSAADEREDLQGKIDNLMQRSDDLQLKLEGADDEEKKQSLETQQAEVIAEIQQLQEKQNYLFADRALNAIADLHSLQAAIVRAKLQYAMQDYTGAVERLQSTANSPLLLVSNSELRNAFQVLENSYAQEQPLGAQSVEFKDAMVTLLTYGGNDMASAATSGLTNSMADFVMADQKSYGKDLYTIGLDVSDFPQVVVTLSGRDTVLEELRSRTDLIVRDTHRDVSYTIQQPQAQDLQMNICCLVDESGSMDGDPIRNLCSALSEFIGALDSSTGIGIIGFEDGYTVHAPVSTNHAAVQGAVSAIGAYGGTNITAGIQGGLEALRACQGAKVMLLMTDGQSDIDMGVVEAAAAEGCVIHTIGFGGVNDELLTQIAAASGGQYIKAETATELVNIYLSLAGMIGNEVEVHYTVTEQETEEACRYFFVRIPDKEISLRLDYLLPQPPVVRLDWVSRPLVDSAAMATAREDGTPVPIDLLGDHFDTVTQLAIGGVTAQILSVDDAGESMHIELPAQLGDGWQDITMTQTDGTAYTFEKQIYVGQMLNIHDFQIEALHLGSTNAMLTPEGRLLLADYTQLWDDGPNGEKGTLSLMVSGYLSVPVDADALLSQLQQETPPQTLTLQLQGAIEGAGYVTVSADDSGAAPEIADDRLATGRFTILYEDGQARLVQN